MLEKDNEDDEEDEVDDDRDGDVEQGMETPQCVVERTGMGSSSSSSDPYRCSRRLFSSNCSSS